MANYCRNDIYLLATKSEWNEIAAAFDKQRIDWAPTMDGVLCDSNDKHIQFYTKWGPISTESGCLPELSRLFPTVVFTYKNETEGEYKEYSNLLCNGVVDSKAKSIKTLEKTCYSEAIRFLNARNNVAEGIRHRVEIMPDSRVAADGENRFGECNIFSWNDIVQVSCGNWHTVGLKKDGSIVSCGSNANGQCNVTDYNEKAIAVSCGRYHTAVLFSDGHVRVAGKLEQKALEHSDEKAASIINHTINMHESANEWKKIVKIHSVFDAVIGITSEGEMLIDGFCSCNNSELEKLFDL